MTQPAPIHISVLPKETLDWLNPQPGQIIVDGTLGAGGHTKAICERIGPNGRVLAFDRDPKARANAEVLLKGLPVTLVDSNFCDLPELLDQLEIPKVHGILLDLGLSSDQLADRERGFSFESDGTLDLRFNPDEGEPAFKLVQRLSEQVLADLLYAYGEERLSRRIARAIVAQRREQPITQANQLAAIVRKCYPRSPRGERIDPATRTFQALRIAVNEELKSLDIALKRMPDCLAPGGRLAIISFHSLEDRTVKEAFRDDPRLEVLTKKPLTASPEEVAANPRSRSAKFRVASRV